MKDKPVILVVDDQPQNNELLEALLVPQGYAVVQAVNGEEALEKLAGNQVDLILLDIMMPGIDGFEVTRRVRADDKHRRLPVILVTALREKEDRIKGIEAGCDDFLSKPVDRMELLARVSSLLKVKDYDDLMINYQNELENFRNSMDNSPFGICIRCDDGKTIYANQSVLDLFGYTMEEFLIIPTQARFTPQSFAEIEERKRKQHEGESLPSSYEADIVQKGGGIRHVQIFHKEVTWNGINEVQDLYSDITERKTAEEKLMVSYDKEKILRMELEEEVKARSMFIDVLAHELRTPLTPLLVSSAMLKELMQTEPPGVKTKLVSNIYTSTETMAKRLEELLELARYTRSTFKLNLQPVNLNRFLTQVISCFQPSLDQNQMEIVVSLPKTESLVELDESKTEQVVTNLLSNAMKYGQQGSNIYFKATLDNSALRVDITDEGSGIPHDAQKDLFKPYHRIENDRKIPGLGLGLAVCKQIVEAYGGKIWVESESGKGSTFSF